MKGLVRKLMMAGWNWIRQLSRVAGSLTFDTF